jgi:RimJ/RimL family protein N-acetyltransferase
MNRLHEIELNKVIHRRPTKHDGLAHYQAVRDSYQEVSKFIPWVEDMQSWDLHKHSISLKKMGKSEFPELCYLFFHEEILVGVGHLNPTGWSHSGEISYWVTTGYDGHGLGEHIARAMLRESYKHLGFRHIIIRTDRDNVASKRVAQKLGAEHELTYGYWTHDRRLSNMVVWKIDTPLGRLSHLFDPGYLFDPRPTWGFSSMRTEMDIDYDYAAPSDASLTRSKEPLRAGLVAK